MKYIPTTISLCLPTFVVLLYFWTFRGSLSHDQATWGSFGDLLAGVSAPVAIWLLWKAWRTQKQELSATKQAIEAQVAAQHEQRQQDLFFQLLNGHDRLRADFQFKDAKDHITMVYGNKALESYACYCHNYPGHDDGQGPKTPEQTSHFLFTRSGSVIQLALSIQQLLHFIKIKNLTEQNELYDALKTHVSIAESEAIQTLKQVLEAYQDHYINDKHRTESERIRELLADIQMTELLEAIVPPEMLPSIALPATW